MFGIEVWGDGVTRGMVGIVVAVAAAAAVVVAAAAVASLRVERHEEMTCDNPTCHCPNSSFDDVVVRHARLQATYHTQKRFVAAKWGGELTESTKGGNVHCYPEVGLHSDYTDSHSHVGETVSEAATSTRTPVARTWAPSERILPSAEPLSMEHLPSAPS